MNWVTLYALLKKQIDEKTSTITALTPFDYKGSVSNKESLPTNATKGNVYTTLDDGSEYLWDGINWISIGQDIDLNTKQDKLIAGDGIAILEDGKTITSNITEKKYTNNNPSTVTVGGIPKGTTFDNISLTDIIENMLYPYVAFVFNSLNGGGTYEYGTNIIVSKVTPNFTNGSKNINSIKIGTTLGGEDLYAEENCISGTAITLTTPKEYNGETGGTIYATLSDGITTTTKSTSISYTYYDYALLNTDETAPTSGGVKGRNDYTYSYNSGEYLWMLSHSLSNGKIQTYVAGTWADVNTIPLGKIAFTLNSGATVDYYAYRTDKFSANGSARYRLINK